MENNQSLTGSFPVEFEYISCDLCGSYDTSPILESRDYLKCGLEIFYLVKCNKCGLIYLNPRPTQKTISQFYPEEYRPFINKKNGFIDRFKSLLIKNDIRVFKKLMNREDLKILEVGCANGSYLSQLKKMSKFEVTGVEFSPLVAGYARKTYDINVISGTIFDAKFQDSSFDIVIMRHVLEHVYNPSETIQEIGRILKKDGIFYGIVPNTKCIEVKIFKKWWPGWDLPRHLYDFNPDTIRIILEKNGFQDIDISYQCIPNYWIGSLKNYFEDRNYKKISNSLLNLDNVFLLLTFLPLSYLASILRISGRITVIAKKKITKG
jgi:ubiquinone/menaquinone biosynthesis C-methylase UbiE